MPGARFMRNPIVHVNVKKQSWRRSKKGPIAGEGLRLLHPTIVASDLRKNIHRTPSDLLPKLEDDEKIFLELVHDGVVNDVAVFLEENERLNINCQNYQGFACVNIAIRNADVSMVMFLLQFDNLILGDALLQAIEEQNEQIVEIIFDRQRETDPTLQCAWESAHYPADLSPLMLAAHVESYPSVKLLLEAGYTIDRPHPPSCFCRRKCESRKYGESLADARVRFNSYKALSSPAYICQTATDPVFTAFQLSHELKECANIEKELQSQYMQLSQDCSAFAVNLLNECRTTRDVSLILHKRHGDSAYNITKYSRLSYALDTDQKSFVAHPHCQHVLRSEWLTEWQDWQRLGLYAKLMRLIPRIVLLPMMALVYYLVPNSIFVKSWRCPLNKYVSYAASYLIFLIILLVQNAMDSNISQRGPPSTGFEWFIVIYIFGLTWRNIRSLWRNGLNVYLKENWNIYDWVTINFFMVTFACWAWAYYDVVTHDNITLPREYWTQFDATLVGEAFYSMAILFAFGKLMYFCQIGNYLGPLQVSIGKMLTDIAHFLMVFLLMMASFAVSLHKLYSPYNGQVRTTPDGETVKQSPAFATIIQSIHTLYWSIYGYSPPNFADIITSEHYVTVDNTTLPVINEHRLTSVVGNFMYAMYYIIGIIVLVNILIAMLSTSFSLVQGNADTEWKFARTQIWVAFFEDGNTMPPPFNLIPTPKSIVNLFIWFSQLFRGDKRAKWSCQKCCYTEKEDMFDVDEESYQILMSQLVQRYFTSAQKSREETKRPVKENIQALSSQVRLLKEVSSPGLDVTGNTLWHDTQSNYAPSVAAQPSQSSVNAPQ